MVASTNLTITLNIKAIDKVCTTRERKCTIKE